MGKIHFFSNFIESLPQLPQDEQELHAPSVFVAAADLPGISRCFKPAGSHRFATYSTAAKIIKLQIMVCITPQLSACWSAQEKQSDAIS